MALHYPLERHIFHLLFQEDSLDVPGFGRIESQRFGAEIQLQSGLFLPPARRLSFSPVAGPSQLLVNHISRFENLTPEESSIAIASEVKAWNQKLSEGERLRLEGIGSFSRTGLQWVFQAALESNFLPEAYGLPIFRVTPLAQQQTAPMDLGYQAPLPRITTRREKWFAPIRTAAVVAAAISLFALGTTKEDFREFVQLASFEIPWEEWSDEVTSWFETESDPIEDQEDTFGQQTVSSNPPSMTLEESGQTSSQENASTGTNAPSEGLGGSYSLVVGAFSEVQNANRLVATLQDAGYPSHVLEANQGLTKVVLASYASREEAQSAKEDVKEAFPAVWIYAE